MDILKLKDRLDRLPYTPGWLSAFFGALSFLIRIPFLFRWDLHFGGDSATCYLMALRIAQGDRPLYFYGQDHQGAAEAYGAALLFKIFGPSIPLGGVFALLEWSLASALGIYLLIRTTSKFTGIIGGLFVAIGVPYTLHYVTVPYWGYPGSLLATMAVLVPAYLILDRGPSIPKFLLLGFICGAGLYVGKQCIPGLAAAWLSLLLLPTSRWTLRSFLNVRWWASAAAGFLTGYAPEIYYRLSHTYRHFSDTASSGMVWGNFKGFLKSIPAYFDAQPLARMPEAVYYFMSDMHGYIRPKTPLDFLFAVLGFTVLVFIGCRFLKSYREKDPGLFLLSSLVLLNIAAVLVSQESKGDFNNVRRYLYSSSIDLSIWTGVFFASLLAHRSKWFLRAALVLVPLFFAKVAYNEVSLLRAPDEVRELRWVITSMDSKGYDRGLSHWGHAYVIDALTDQRIVVAGEDYERIPEYAQKVSQADRIALIEERSQSTRKEFTYEGNNYRACGAAEESESFRWIPYQKVK